MFFVFRGTPKTMSAKILPEIFIKMARNPRRRKESVRMCTMKRQTACNFGLGVLHRQFLSFLIISIAALNVFVTELTAQTVPAGCSGEEIQRALDRLPAGGEVVLAPGTYIVRQPIVLQRDHQTLRGSGSSTVLFLADNANCPVVILGAPGDAPERSISHLRLADLLIDGNRLHQQTETWQAAGGGPKIIFNNGVSVWNVIDTVIERVVCCRCRSGGLVSAGGTRRLTVRDFTAFDNQFDGLACYRTEDSLFTGLQLHDNLAAGISLDLSFDHNLISEALLAGNTLGLFMRDSRDNLFQGLIIRRSRDDGVFMAQADIQTRDGWQLSPNTECTGNSFVGLAISGCGGKPFLVNDAACTNNVVYGAQFQDNDKGGSALASAKPAPARNLLGQ